jgi:hypothetical protein
MDHQNNKKMVLDPLGMGNQGILRAKASRHLRKNAHHSLEATCCILRCRDGRKDHKLHE